MNFPLLNCKAKNTAVTNNQQEQDVTAETYLEPNRASLM